MYPSYTIFVLTLSNLCIPDEFTQSSQRSCCKQYVHRRFLTHVELHAGFGPPKMASIPNFELIDLDDQYGTDFKFNMIVYIISYSSRFYLFCIHPSTCVYVHNTLTIALSICIYRPSGPRIKK